jgi:hypothetical protein
MRRKLLVTLLASASGVIVSAGALAHHGFAAYSDERVTVKATMTDFRFVNPHVQLFFEIENEAGQIEQWQGELTAPNKLARAGWTKGTLKAGDEIQISGEVARNGGHSIRIREIITATGESLPLFESLD